MPAVRALPRERLLLRLAGVWEHRLGLVVAPAGSGKTTLLAQFATALPDPVAWYRAESSDGDAGALLAYLQRSLGAAVGGLPEQPWRTVEDAVDALEGWSGGRALLVIDDLHALRGSSAEALLARLVDYLPPNVAIVAGSRAAPGFDISRLQVADGLLEIRADDLRFRSWEVERLFHEFYRERHPPEELAELARRTEGWAAGLQLFHLATRDRRPDERRGVLAALKARSRLAREYLAGNVLAHLPADRRRFLLDTCVLGRLSGPLCDTLTGRAGSAEILEQLAAGQIFTVRVDPDGSYRYHEVLRSHLSAALVDEVGEGEARRRHVRAGAVLEDAGALHDALLAYCRGEDWRAVGRLLGHEGEQIAHDPGEWLDLLPPSIADHPWVQLATARRWRADGRWGNALAAYRKAEDHADSHGADELGRRERVALASWLEPSRVAQPGWAGLVRQATVRDPRAVSVPAARIGGAHGGLAGGLALLLAGDVGAARAALVRAAQSSDSSATLAVGARLAAAIAAILGGDSGQRVEIESAAEDAEALGVPWLGRLGRCLLTLDPGGAGWTGPVGAAPPGTDRWGEGLVALFAGLGALSVGMPVSDDVRTAGRGFAEFGAGVLEAWCLAVHALGLANAGAPEALRAAREAESRARVLAVPGAEALAQLALAACRPERAEALLAAARATAGACGLRLPPGGAVVPAGGPAMPPGEPAAPPGAGPAPAVSVRCFGGFALTAGGQPVPLGGVRPRVRALLRLLAVHGGRAVHREVIAEALWPEADGETSTRGLHVAVSSLRRMLSAVPGLTVDREGDAYRLALPADASVDVVAFEVALEEGHRARRRGDGEAAVAAYEKALGLYPGQLLPEEGPAEWLHPLRDRFEAQAADAAHALAQLLFERDDTAAATLACERGLEIDCYRDGLWRTLIHGLETAGDHAAAAHASRRYDDMLAGLGLTPPTADSLR